MMFDYVKEIHMDKRYKKEEIIMDTGLIVADIVGIKMAGRIVEDNI